MVRSPCCEKVGLKKGPWTPEEDQKLLAYIEQHGHGSWRALPAKAGLQRCGKSCRLRWTNYLRPDIKRGKFTLHEEQTIIQLHALLGNRWSAIATHLPKRTDNEIKNYWNTHLKKRLVKMGIDPVTHKPKTHALSSGNAHYSKDAANLSHMAQWETARLEAEARLARDSSKPLLPHLQYHQSSICIPSQTNNNSHQFGDWRSHHVDVGGPLATSQLLPVNGNGNAHPRSAVSNSHCLDILRALQGSTYSWNPPGGCLTSVSLHCPTPGYPVFENPMLPLDAMPSSVTEVLGNDSSTFQDMVTSSVGEMWVSRDTHHVETNGGVFVSSCSTTTTTTTDDVSLLDCCGGEWTTASGGGIGGNCCGIVGEGMVGGLRSELVGLEEEETMKGYCCWGSMFDAVDMLPDEDSQPQVLSDN